MNRPIKFRAWSKEDKVFLYSDVETGTKNPMVFFWEAVKTLDMPVQQFTGLLDKNGKEIYEGDVVEWDDDSDGRWRRRCAVGYSGAHYTLTGYYYDANVKDSDRKPIDFNMGAFTYEYETDKELEVIGNIYENPELIK